MTVPSFHIPVYLSFANVNQTGRFVGLAFAKSDKVGNFDHSEQNLAGVFHMDYKIHSSNYSDDAARRKNNWDWWTAGNGHFEFAIPKENAALRG